MLLLLLLLSVVLIIITKHTGFKYAKFNLLEWMHNLGRAWDNFLRLLVGMYTFVHTHTHTYYTHTYYATATTVRHTDILTHTDRDTHYCST